MTRVILITGTPGSGKTTIANELSKRLKTFQVVGTDTIREVWRSCVKKKDDPVIHSSAIIASKYAPKKEYNKIVWSYERQSSTLKPGIEAVIRRFARENRNLILEGVHLLPGTFSQRSKEFKEVQITHVLLYVVNRKEHIRRLLTQGEKRSASKIAHFNLVRSFQNFLIKKAKDNNILIINNTSLERTLRKLKSEVTFEDWD